MKTYDQLTKEQKIKAIAFARSILEESIFDGVYTTNRPVTEEDMEELSLAAAEGSDYDDEGNALMGLNVPPYYLGGCV